MKAREFTINVPIKININGDADPEISVDDTDQETDDEGSTFVPPLQQNLELRKASLGKNSQVIDDLLDDDNPLGEETEDD